MNLIPARFIRPYEHNGQRLDMYKGSIFAGRAPNSRANFLRKMLSRKIRERKLKEIWNRKQKYRKWKRRTFRLQSLFNYGLSADLPL